MSYNADTKDISHGGYGKNCSKELKDSPTRSTTHDVAYLYKTPPAETHVKCSHRRAIEPDALQHREYLLRLSRVCGLIYTK